MKFKKRVSSRGERWYVEENGGFETLKRIAEKIGKSDIKIRSVKVKGTRDSAWDEPNEMWEKVKDNQFGAKDVVRMFEDENVVHPDQMTIYADMEGKSIEIVLDLIGNYNDLSEEMMVWVRFYPGDKETVIKVLKALGYSNVKEQG